MKRPLSGAARGQGYIVSRKQFLGQPRSSPWKSSEGLTAHYYSTIRGTRNSMLDSRAPAMKGRAPAARGGRNRCCVPRSLSLAARCGLP